MKRLLALLLAVVMVFAMVACSATEEADTAEICGGGTALRRIVHLLRSF